MRKCAEHKAIRYQSKMSEAALPMGTFGFCPSQPLLVAASVSGLPLARTASSFSPGPISASVNLDVLPAHGRGPNGACWGLRNYSSCLVLVPGHRARMLFVVVLSHSACNLHSSEDLMYTITRLKSS